MQKQINGNDIINWCITGSYLENKIFYAHIFQKPPYRVCIYPLETVIRLSKQNVVSN